jgi:hypothetical protein
MSSSSRTSSIGAASRQWRSALTVAAPDRPTIVVALGDIRNSSPRAPSTRNISTSRRSTRRCPAGREIDVETFDALINDVLFSVGWRMADGAQLDPWSGARAARDTVRVLAHMGALVERDHITSAKRPESGGTALARAALQAASAVSSTLRS